MRGPHKSDLTDESIAHFADEAKSEVETKWALLVLYDEVKGDIPEQMNF